VDISVCEVANGLERDVIAETNVWKPAYQWAISLAHAIHNSSSIPPCALLTALIPVPPSLHPVLSYHSGSPKMTAGRTLKSRAMGTGSRTSELGVSAKSWT